MVASVSALGTSHLYPQEMHLVFISVRGYVDPRAIVLSEGIHISEKFVTPAGSESATFRFVAQHHNHSTTAVPIMSIKVSRYLVCWLLASRILHASCQYTCMTYTIAVCKVKNSIGGQRKCPKHVEFYSKKKFVKLVHLIGFIIRMFLFLATLDLGTRFSLLFGSLYWDSDYSGHVELYMLFICVTTLLVFVGLVFAMGYFVPAVDGVLEMCVFFLTVRRFRLWLWCGFSCWGVFCSAVAPLFFLLIALGLSGPVLVLLLSVDLGWPSCTSWFWGAFAKLRNATTIFVVSTCSSNPSSVTSFCLHGTTPAHLNVFSWNLIFEYF